MAKMECDASAIIDDSPFPKRLCGVGDDRGFSFPSSENGPCFLFCIRSQGKSDQHHWYRIHPPVHPEPDPLPTTPEEFRNVVFYHYQELTIHPYFKMPDNIGRDFTSVVVDSKIYFFGCDADPVLEPHLWGELLVKIYDFNTGKWSLSRSGIRPQRKNTSLVVHEGVIYIMGWTGKYEYDEEEIYTAILDTRRLSWMYVGNPRCANAFGNAHTSCAVYEDYILTVISSKFAYMCDPLSLYEGSSKNFWGSPTILKLPRDLNPPGSKNILVMSSPRVVLMYVYPSLIVAPLDDFFNGGPFDFSHVNGSFQDFTKSATPDGRVFLFCGGGADLYFLWSPKPDKCGDEAKTEVHCVRFHLIYPSGDEGWTTSVRETTVYTTECAGGDLVDCVHMLS